MTNREWLLKEMQNMSDEKLARRISDIDTVNVCDEQRSKGICKGRICEECKLEWLKKQYKGQIKLSEAEKIILENIDNRYRWIARDLEDGIGVYEEKPHKREYGWWDIEPMSSEYESLSAFNHLFEFVKWEDEEPYNIEELLKSSNED